MTINFTFKYTSCVLEYIPNDISIKLTAYLIDSNDQLYIDPNTLAIDTFTVQLYKSSLPANNYVNYLSVIAGNAIRTKYNQSIGGYCVANSDIVTQIASTANIIPGLYIKGTNIPPDTTVMNVRDTKSIKLSQPLTITESASLELTTIGWNIDYSSLAELTTIINFDLL